VEDCDAVSLRSCADAVSIDLGVVLAEVYERGSFAQRLNYDQPPVPRLTPEDAAWAESLLRERPKR
jgi:hypothetical protein